MSNSLHSAFEKLNDQPVESLNLMVETYRHKSTGTLHYHLKADNQENVFLVGLRTVPQDSTGVAHILEHTVLCGSRKYPVRDPFFMMIRRSLNTFMNAFTSSDWTAYPFASLNKTDFSNLMEVYLDAVFFPNIDPMDFAQEGHRVEFEEPENPESPLVYKGVVYNEMKGAMSSPVSYMWQKLTSHLYPGTTYHYNSGGDPAEIPSLSHAQLIDFYKTHYHPSNAVFFTFGDIPASEHQEKFHEYVLKHFDKSPTQVTVNKATRFSEPKRFVDYYPAESEDDSQQVVLAWLLGESSDLRQQMAAVLLSSALLDNSSSPLSYALENSELGRAPSPLCGLEDSHKEMVFIAGLEGVEEGSEAEVEALIMNVLYDIAENGIEQERLQAVLHQLELAQKEITGGSYPYGMQLILDMLPLAIHGGDPVSAINLGGVISELNDAIQDPEYIKVLVKEMLINNSHRLLLSMKPDSELKAREEAEEKSNLAQLKATMTDQEKLAVIQRALALKQRQEKQDDENILPKVGIKDVPYEMSIASGNEKKIASITGSSFLQGTNGIVYEQLITELPELTTEETILLPLYTHCLCDLGFGNRSYLEVQALLDSYTGGVHCYTSMRSDAHDINHNQNFLVLSGKALAQNQEKLVELMLAFVNDARFDELDRIQDLVSQWRVRKENSITGNGHSLAMLASAQSMSPLANYNNMTRGLLSILQVRQWDEDFKDIEKLAIVSKKLQVLHDKIKRGAKRFLLIGDDAHKEAILISREEWYSKLPDVKHSSGLVLLEKAIPENQSWLTNNTQVNFCSKSYKAVAPYHEDGAALMVLGGFMKNGFLHRAIREQGGAYGGGAGYDSDAGAFRFYSYRDPRLAETFNDFDASIDWLLSNPHTADRLEEAILGVIGSIDKPSSPAGEAKSAYHNDLFGRTADKRQALRRRILQVSLDELVAVGEKYLTSDQPSSAVLSSQNNWDKQGMDGFIIKHL